jgi:hypothetical protein
MTQKEYIAASLKIIGLVILVYGGITLARNLMQGSYAYYQSKQVSASYTDSVPSDIQKEYDAKNKSVSRGNRFMSVMHLSRIPANLVVILFGLALTKRDRWFTEFLIGKDK